MITNTNTTALTTYYFGGKTRPENIINDVQHTKGCLSTSYPLYTAYILESTL